ncbi:dipeptide/oligopeptide/nickel ABC transporter permease/ATP-binding protein [Nonomuraea sp. NPDC050536]|uniref:dipeptide/oligopeptide/nickel ABC transporter permease/ATP-binding protein n=1 Tax=Nonomuraea sp. NPDC050536 TaxID=3364366 RepID=UPI0037C57DB2
MRSSTSRGAWATPMGVTAAAMVGVLVLLMVAGSAIWGAAAEHVDASNVLSGPSSGHLLGTDNLGRDVLARILAGSGRSLSLALIATILGAGAGVLLGSLIAVVGTRGRRLLGGLINLLLAFPALLVAIFCAVIFGAGAAGAVLALAVAYTPSFARLTQTLAAGVVESEYVSAARVLGLRWHRLLLRHVLPNIAEPLLLNVTLAAGATLVGLSGLSFLGLGVQAPDYDWGLLLSQGLQRIYASPLPAVAPGFAIVFAGLALQLLGEVWAGKAACRAGVRPAPPPVTAVERSERPRPDDEVLLVENLTVGFDTGVPVRGVTLALRRGEIVGLVGESGSGKSLTALALAGLTPPAARVRCDRHRFLGEDVTALQAANLATGMAMIFQNPASALNPALRIGTQLTEAVRVHRGTGRKKALEQARDSLARVALPAERRILRARPFSLSGGMRQRVMIAMGLMTRPRLIIADEPTTALDVTVQQQIIDLLAGIRRSDGTAILFISHDVAVVSQLCDRILVMYGGRLVESLPASRLVGGAAHPYTRALVAAVPDLAADRHAPLATIEGSPPDPSHPAAGCPFVTRCAAARSRCEESEPELSPVDAEQEVACWYPMTAS